MNRLEDYLKEKGDPGAIQTLRDSPHFKGSELEQSLQSLEDEIKKQVQIDLNKRLENMTNFDPKNSHQIDAIIDDGGISEFNERERAIIEMMHEDEEHYVDHEILDGGMILDGHVFVSDSQLKELEKFDNEEAMHQMLFGMSEEEFTERQIEFHQVEFEEKRIETNIIPDYLLNDPEIVGYPDEEMQDEIYEWVISKFEGTEFSVKDLGCGRGDLTQYFNNGINYIGIDSNPNLIAVGRQKYPGINLINDDFLSVNEQTDYTICIGTMNDEHGFNKWDYFNKTLNHALNTTNKSVIFVLSANNDGNDRYLDYPFHEMVLNLGTDLLFEIDYTKFKDIYCLTVHIGSYNETE